MQAGPFDEGYPPEFMNALGHRLPISSLPVFDMVVALPFLECKLSHVLCKYNIEVAEIPMCKLWHAVVKEKD